MRTNVKSVILAGFMGTGKTSAGRRLAERLGLRFVDLDTEIEAAEGRAISEIFARDGEPYFRAVEKRLAQKWAATPGVVLATGGGAVLDPDNVACFRHSGLLVCLTARPEIILARVARETHRPLLEQADKERRILELLEKRRAIYAALPHTIDTSDLTVDEVVARILALVGATDNAH